METDRVIEANSDKNYRQNLNEELREISTQELWEAGRVFRHLRPKNWNFKTLYVLFKKLAIQQVMPKYIIAIQKSIFEQLAQELAQAPVPAPVQAPAPAPAPKPAQLPPQN